MPDNPQLGVEAIWDSRGFDEGFKKYLRGLKAAEEATDDLANKSAASSRKRAAAAEKAEDSIAKSLMKTRREIMTVLFFIRLLERGWAASWESIEAAAAQGAERMGIRALARRLETDLGGTAAAIKNLAEGAMSTRESLQVVLQGLLTDQGQFSDEYAKLWEAARVAAVTTGVEASEAFEAFVTDLVEGTGEASDAIIPIYGIQRALESYAAASGRTVKELGQEEAAHITLQQIYRETGYLLDEGAREALGYAESWDRVQARLNEFKEVAGIFISDSGVLATLNRLVTSATQSLAILGAGIAAVRENLQEWGGPTQAFFGLGAEIGMAAQGAPSDAFSEHMQRYADALGFFQDEVDKRNIDYEALRPEGDEKDVDYSPIIDHLLKREKLIEDHTHRVEQIWDRYYDRLEQAELRYQQSIDSAQRMAERSRARAQRRYDRQRQRQVEDNNRRLRKLQESYHLRLEQNEREYHLRSLQSEALYQYERGLAVAYGDVLGIEDLDARYTLEKQAREDNFKEQQRQETENYELRRRFMQEEMEAQLEQLRQALDDQMEEIRLREEERIAEAEERRKAEIERAGQARDQQLEEELRQHERSLEQWSQYWVKLARRFELGLSDINQILAQFFGAGSEFDSIMDQVITKWESYMGYLTQLTQLIANLRRGAAGPLPGIGIPPQQPPGNPYYRPYQYGGSMIANRPTRMMVGEGHMPEMISTRPLSPIGTLKLSWAGGPIPVTGSGLEGADTSGLGDAIAQGLLGALEKSIVRTGATYG
jgi:hypothetical protein